MKILILSFLAIFLGQLTIQAGPSEPVYVHTLTWKKGSNELEKDSKGILFLDGKNLGPLNKSLPVIKALKPTKSQRIRLDMPANEINGDLWTCFTFLFPWLVEGVKIDFYQSSKQLNVHTLTWSNFIKQGNVDPKKARIWFDQKDFGLADEALSKIENEEFNRGDILLIYMPFPELMVMSASSNGIPKDLFPRIYNICKMKGVIFYNIQGFSADETFNDLLEKYPTFFNVE